MTELGVCRDAFGKHPDQLTEDDRGLLIEMIALAVIEGEDLEARLNP